jgi:hypothetical protein
VQREQRQVVIAADAVDQPPRRSDRHALGRDDHQVIAVGEVHRLEQRTEPLLFAEQDGVEIPGGTDDIDARAGKVSGNDVRLLDRAQIIIDLDSPAADAAVGVWLFEMPARVIDDIPVDAVLLDVIGQQSLGKIPVLKLLVVSQHHDLGARLVEDLPRHRRQGPAAARGHVGIFQNAPRRLLLRRAWLPGHARDPISDVAGMPLLRFLLPRPFAGRGLDRIEDVVSDVARARLSHRAAPHRQ